MGITSRGVSKRFTIYHEKARSFKDLVTNAFRQNGSREVFWALRDVSFEVGPGDSLGVVGPNGSGKSTLLKLITRILRPTSGSIQVEGKVAGLLELGAGFHPDLTGRDNIFLNASILGIGRSEASEKFWDIVRFAELERFIDTPVKHFSSGMYARLGFAVAIHVDADILLIDEVLSVGDEAFQAKCLERIGDFRKQGKAIVLVSHDLGAVSRLCNKVLWLDQGQVRALGDPLKVIDSYLATAHEKERLRYQEERQRAAPAKPEVDSVPSVDGEQPIEQVTDDATLQNRWGSGEVEILGVTLLDSSGVRQETLFTGAPMTVRIHYRAHQPIPNPVFGIALYNGPVHLSGPNTKFSGVHIPRVEGEGDVDYVIPSLPLLEGHYSLSAAVYDYTCTHPFDHHHRMYSFQVQTSSVAERYGLLYIPSTWEHRGRARS